MSMGPSQAWADSRTASRIRPLDAVALDCSSQHLAYGEPYTGRVTCPNRFRAITAPQKEHRHVSRELPAAALVHPLKIRVFQQMPRFWKLAAGGGSHIKRSALTRRVSFSAAAESCDDSLTTSLERSR